MHDLSVELLIICPPKNSQHGLRDLVNDRACSDIAKQAEHCDRDHEHRANSGPQPESEAAFVADEVLVAISCGRSSDWDWFLS